MRRQLLALALPVFLVNAPSLLSQASFTNPALLAPPIAADSGRPIAAPAGDSSIAGASRDGLRAGVQSRPIEPTARPLMAPTQAGLGQSKAMMIVGGAALIVGAVIGNTAGSLIMVGGAVVGLVGLYEYLR